MKEKAGWKYKFSTELNQKVALHIASGWLFCEDGTKYSPDEIAVLNKNHQTISLQAHLIKKVFDGKLVSEDDIK